MLTTVCCPAERGTNGGWRLLPLEGEVSGACCQPGAPSQLPGAAKHTNAAPRAVATQTSQDARSHRTKQPHSPPPQAARVGSGGGGGRWAGRPGSAPPPRRRRSSARASGGALYRLCCPLLQQPQQPLANDGSEALGGGVTAHGGERTRAAAVRRPHTTRLPAVVMAAHPSQAAPPLSPANTKNCACSGVG